MCATGQSPSILIKIINMSAWLTRDQALDLLGVKPQTLYAYVSRQLLTAIGDPTDPRRSLYSRADAERLCARRKRGRSRAVIVEDAISWGDAVLPTVVSAITGGRLFYRGRDAVRLAEQATLEEAAALLLGVAGLPMPASLLGVDPDLAPLDAAMSMLAGAAVRSDPTVGRAASSLVDEAAVLLLSTASALGADLGDGRDIAAGFAYGWECGPAGAETIRTALVVMADHELNASTFAARVTASTGAPLAAAVLSGLCALLGPAHGAATRRVRALMEEAFRDGAAACVRNCLARGEPLPGFGHKLYPDVDPRAEAILRMTPLPEALVELIRVATETTGHGPNVDFASVAMAFAFDLPKDAPLSLFASARTAGWLAHAVEQAGSGRLIRPRARYEGRPPER